MRIPGFIHTLAGRLLLIGLVMTLLPSGNAHGQGTMGAVPDPINARDLASYADRLGLSPQQRQTVELLHEAYREEFRALREGEIEKTLSEMPGGGMGGGFGGMGGMGAMNADRKVIEKSLRDLEGVNNRIKGVDNSFFDQMQAVLTEDQTAMMQRVRMMRDRARYRTGLARMSTFMNPAAQVDLSTLTDDLTLSEEERQQVDPLLSTYESSLTSAARKLHEEGGRMALELLDRMKALGFDAQTMQDRERRGQMFEAFRGAWGEINGKLQERAADVTNLNRKTVRTIAPLMESANGRRLHDDFMARGYPEANAGASTANRAFALALKLDDLTEEQRATLTTLRDEHFAALDRINEQIMDVIDERRKTTTMFGGDGEQRRKFDESAAELREKLASLNTSADQSLRATIGPEQAEKLDQRLAKGGANAETVELVSGRAMFTISPSVVAGAGGGPITFTANAIELTVAGEAIADPYLPGPISQRNLETYGRRLKLDEDQTTIMAGVHEEYLSRFAELEANQYKSVRDMESGLWAVDPKTQQMTPPTAAQIDNLYAARRSALETAIGIDATFFDDLGVTLPDTQAAGIARLRQTRLRDLYSRDTGASNGMIMATGAGGGPGQRGAGGGQRFNMIGGGSAVVDLLAVVDDVKVTPTDPAAFDAALLEHETAVMVAMKTMYENNVRFQQRMDKLNAENAQPRANADRRGPGGGGGNAWREGMENEGRAARDAKQAVIARNQETLTALRALLSEADADTLRRAYNHKAFADVFRDGRSAEPKLTAALQLPDLTDQQRSQVETITGEFRMAYDEISEKMIELQANAPQFGGPGGNRDWQSMQESIRTGEKLRFDRTDLNDRTITRLRSLLSEDQVQRLGGLDIDPAE